MSIRPYILALIGLLTLSSCESESGSNVIVPKANTDNLPKPLSKFVDTVAIKATGVNVEVKYFVEVLEDDGRRWTQVWYDTLTGIKYHRLMNIDDTSTIVIDPQVIPTLALGYYFTFTNLPYTKSNDTLRVVLSGPNVGEHIKRINPTIHRYGELSYSTWHQTDTYTFKGYTDSTKFEIVMWKKKQ